MPGHTSKEKCEEDTEVGCRAHTGYDGTSDLGQGRWVTNGGGLEIYYRWGDVVTDCNSCVNDSRGYTQFISLGDPTYGNREGNLIRSALNGGSIGWRDIVQAKTLPESIYVSGTGNGAGSDSIEYLDVETDCSLTGNYDMVHLNAPYLHHIRAVYTGTDACGAGDCLASIYFRKEK